VWKSLANIKGLGFGGTTWNNVTGARGYGSTYTNNLTYPILVLISYVATAGSTTYAYVNETIVQYSGAHATTERDNLSFIVPPGATYSVGRLFGDYIEVWSELY